MKKGNRIKRITTYCLVTVFLIIGSMVFGNTEVQDTTSKDTDYSIAQLKNGKAIKGNMSANLTLHLESPLKLNFRFISTDEGEYNFSKIDRIETIDGNKEMSSKTLRRMYYTEKVINVLLLFGVFYLIEIGSE